MGLPEWRGSRVVYYSTNISAQELEMLCKSQTKPLGVSHFHYNNQTNAIVTFSTLGIQIFDLEAKGGAFQKCWVPSNTSRITTKAVREPRTGKFWCVENDSTLCSWELDTKSFAAATRRFPLK